MTIVLLLLIALIGLDAPVAARTQAPSLSFGLRRITIGMSESAVRAVLKEYVLGNWQKRGNDWQVLPDERDGSRTHVPVWLKGNPPTTAIGMVVFEGGRLIEASIYWPKPQIPDDSEFRDAENIYWALWGMRGNDCAIDTKQFVSGAVNHKDIDIRCYAVGRGVHVSTNRTTRTTAGGGIIGGVTISEYIFQPR